MYGPCYSLVIKVHWYRKYTNGTGNLCTYTARADQHIIPVTLQSMVHPLLDDVNCQMIIIQLQFSYNELGYLKCMVILWFA